MLFFIFGKIYEKLQKAMQKNSIFSVADYGEFFCALCGKFSRCKNTCNLNSAELQRSFCQSWNF